LLGLCQTIGLEDNVAIQTGGAGLFARHGYSPPAHRYADPAAAQTVTRRFAGGALELVADRGHDARAGGAKGCPNAIEPSEVDLFRIDVADRLDAAESSWAIFFDPIPGLLDSTCAAKASCISITPMS